MPKNTQNEKQNEEGLTEIVDELFKTCESYALGILEKNMSDFPLFILKLRLSIDNIPTLLMLRCKINDNYDNSKHLVLMNDICWDCPIDLENCQDEYFKEQQHFIKITKNEDKNTYDVCKGSFEVAISKIFSDLNIFKFDKITNKFIIDKSDITNKIINYFNLKHQGLDECCVCNDKTTLATSCNHHLCFQCINKIKIYNGADDNNHACFKCPMCRRRVEKMKICNMLNLANEDSEYEDEN